MGFFVKFLSEFIYFKITRPSDATDINPGRTILCFEVDVRSIDPYVETIWQPETLWENGKMVDDDGISEDDFWQDSLVIGTNPPFGMIRCSTLRWPSNLHFGINSYVRFVNTRYQNFFFENWLKYFWRSLFFTK